MDPPVDCLVDGQPGERISVRDPAVAYGMAVFEVARTYAGRPFRLGQHLQRLRASAEFFGFPWPGDGPLEQDCSRVLDARTDHADCAIHILLTGGGCRVVRLQALDRARVGAPIRLGTLRWTPPAFLPGWVKHTDRAGWMMAAKMQGVDEVVFEDADGLWTEANRSNVFVVRQGVILTPPDDGRILRGVTRAALLDAARAEGLAIREEAVRAGPCDEFYVASTLKELAPVVRLDGRPVAGAGPAGAALAAAFDRLRAREVA